MDIREKLRRALLGDVTPDFYADNRENLRAENLQTFRFSLWVAAVMSLVVLGASFVLTEMQPVTPVYVVLCLTAFIGMLLAYLVLPRHTGAVNAVFYVYIVFWDLAALALGTVYTPHDPAAAYYMITLVLSILLLDLPVRPLALTLAIDVMFCVVSARLKVGYPVAVQTDLIDCLYAMGITIFAGSYILNIRLKNLQAVQIFRVRSETDKLTGLSNKAAIDSLCRTCLAQPGGGGFALIMLDVDDFKRINDTLGHATGDEVLHNIGITIRAMFREEDVVGRFGGDEFLVLMKNIGGSQNAQAKAEQLHARLADIVAGGESISCSMGVAVSAPGRAVSFEQLFSHADMALYSSKTTGKNRITLYCADAEETVQS